MWRCGKPECNCEGHRLGWLDGDKVAAQELCRNLKPLIDAIIRRRLTYAPREQQDEVRQDTFLRLHRALARWKGKCPLCLWAGQIAARAALDQSRRDRRATRLPTSADDPDRHADKRSQPLPPQVWRCIDRTVARLPADLRQVFELHVQQELTIAETARTLGTVERTIYNRLDRIKTLLLACLD